MSFKDSFSGAQQGAFEKQVASKIYDGIRKLEREQAEAGARRWIWELLQNAKDTARENTPVRAEIELTEYNSDGGPEGEEEGPGHFGTVTFRHSGRPFTPPELHYLIVQASSKERAESGEEQQSTGKFGTGFLTTHLLSRTVFVEGIMVHPDEDLAPVNFEVELDRTGKSVEKVRQGVRRALNVQERLDDFPPVGDFSPDDFNTSYTYPLDERGYQVAETGIQDLQRCIPYTLAFNPSIGELVIRKDGEEVSYHADRCSDEGIGQRVYVDQIYSSGEEIRSELLVVKDNDVSVALSLESENGTKRPSPPDVEQPRLYCSLPLVGSEVFGLPVVVNSHSFEPNEERSGVVFSGRDDDVSHNRSLLKTSVSLFDTLVDYGAEEEWADLYQLADVKEPSSRSWEDSSWYKSEILAPVRKQLCSRPLVRKESGQLASFDSGSVTIPWDKDEEVREKLWELGQGWGKVGGIYRDHIHNWYELAWGDLPSTTMRSLVSWVSQQGDVSTLAEKLSKDADETLDWLSDLITFLADQDDRLRNLLRRHTHRMKTKEYCLYPNQNGSLRWLGNIKFDDGRIPEKLKDIASRLGRDVRNELLDQRVKIGDLGCSTMEAEDVANLIWEEVRGRLNSSINQDSETRQIFRDLLVWMNDNNQLAKELFPDLWDQKYRLRDDEEVARDIQRAEELDRLEEKVKEVGYDSIQELIETTKESQNSEDSDEPSLSDDEIKQARAAAQNMAKVFDRIKKLISEGRIDGWKEDDLETLMNQHPGLFEHIATHTVEAFQRWLVKVNRAKDEVRKRLDEIEEYDISGWNNDPVFPSIVTGIKRSDRDRELHLVIRPADQGYIVLFEDLEVNVLTDPDSELWIEGAGYEPQRFNIGKLAQFLGVNRIPLSVPDSKPAHLILN